MPETTTDTTTDTPKVVTASEVVTMVGAVETLIEHFHEQGGKFTDTEHRFVSRSAARIRHHADEMTE